MTYSEKLKDPRWQKLRLEILQRDSWTCQLCNDRETTIHIHHKKYSSKDPWSEPSENLVAVCKHCHQLVEELKKENIAFDKFFVYKITDWSNDTRTMFALFDKNIYMSIYGNNGKFIVAYFFENELLGNLQTLFDCSKSGAKPTRV